MDKPTMRSCGNDVNRYKREWQRWARFDNRHLKYHKERRERKKLSYKEYRGTLTCQKCGTPDNIEFHHRDPSTVKRRADGDRVTSASVAVRSVKQWQQHLQDCDILCNTCHGGAH
jgi:hypothetical protein